MLHGGCVGAHDCGATRCGSACLPARLRCGGSGRRRLQQVVPITGTPFPIDATTPGQPPGQTLGRDGVAGGVPRSGQPSCCTMLSSCSPLASPVAYCVCTFLAGSTAWGPRQASQNTPPPSDGVGAAANLEATRTTPGFVRYIRCCAAVLQLTCVVFVSR